MLEWIESTGTQYIDTGINATSNVKVEIKLARFPNIHIWGAVIGARTSAGTNDEYAFFRTGDGLYRSDFSGNRVNFSSSINLLNVATIIKDKNTTTIGSETITNTSSTFTSAFHLYLFACNNGGSVANESSFRCYYCKIWENDTLVRDFIPVMDTNNEVCLWDNVSEAFFYNQGRGFFKGSETPTYIGIDYLESTGEQYIDTNLTTQATYRVIATGYNTYGLTYSGIHYGNSMLGARVSATNSNFQYANGAYNEFVGAGTQQLSLTRNTNTDLLTLHYWKTAYEIYCGNYTQTQTGLTMTISTPLNIYLFGLNNNGTLAGGTWKILNANLYNTNNLIQKSFAPVIRKSDNQPCLYDFVSGEFYTNAGTGTFLYG